MARCLRGTWTAWALIASKLSRNATRLGRRRAHGLALRHDWDPHYRSAHYLGPIACLGVTDDAAFLGEPQINGYAER
jgi:transposase InsO family protein